MVELADVAEAFVTEIEEKCKNAKCACFSMPADDVYEKLEEMHEHAGLGEEDGEGFTDAQYYELVYLIRRLNPKLLTEGNEIRYMAHKEVEEHWTACHVCGVETDRKNYGYKDVILCNGCYRGVLEIEAGGDGN